MFEERAVRWLSLALMEVRTLRRQRLGQLSGEAWGAEGIHTTAVPAVVSSGAWLPGRGCCGPFGRGCVSVL
jgi:hypothetical protein